MPVAPIIPLHLVTAFIGSAMAVTVFGVATGAAFHFARRLTVAFKGGRPRDTTVRRPVATGR